MTEASSPPPTPSGTLHVLHRLRRPGRRRGAGQRGRDLGAPSALRLRLRGQCRRADAARARGHRRPGRVPHGPDPRRPWTSTQLVEDKLPDNLTALSPVIAGGVRTVVQEALQRVLANDTHPSGDRRRAPSVPTRPSCSVLEGGSLTDGANVENGAVSLNLLPSSGTGSSRCRTPACSPASTSPSSDTSADPADQIEQLEDAIGRDLPDDFGQIVVYESEQIAAAQAAVARAQQALVLFRRAVIVILDPHGREPRGQRRPGRAPAPGAGHPVARRGRRHGAGSGRRADGRAGGAHAGPQTRVAGGAEVDGRVTGERADDRGDPRADRGPHRLRDRLADRRRADRPWPCAAGPLHRRVRLVGGRRAPRRRRARRRSPSP